METVIRIIQFFLSLTLLVTVHEFGHFIMARLFRIRVDKFYIFFDWGFSLFKFKRGDTEYGMGWLPLGGYCQIAAIETCLYRFVFKREYIDQIQRLLRT